MTNPTKDFLSKAKRTDDATGDLIADMRRDSSVPSRFETIDQVRSYLRSKGASPEALQAVSGFWRRYQAWIDRNPGAL